MNRILLAVSLLCALADAALSAEVRLGPEKALTPLGALGPAAYAQTAPAVASNGQDFLAVWTDARRGRRFYDIYGSRIGLDGQPREPNGRLIAASSYGAAVIASAGDDYVVAYSTDTGVRTQRLDQNGAPLAAAYLAAGSDHYLRPQLLVSNGENYLLALAKSAGTSDQLGTVTLLGRDGAPLHTIWTGPELPMAATVRGGQYVFLGYSSAVPNRLVLHTVSNAGNVADTPLPPIAVAFNQIPAAALSPDRILLVWRSEKDEIKVLMMGYDGSTVRGPVTIDTQTPHDYLPVASWNGSEFKIVYGRGPATAVIGRITSDGTLLDPIPYVLTSHRSGTSSPAFASADETQIVVWPDLRQGDHDIMARTFTSFDSLFKAQDQGNLISWSGGAQSSVRMARNGDHEITVWSDQQNRLLASVNGPAISIGTMGNPPNTYNLVAHAAAASDSNFLIVWYDQTNRVMAERVAFDGHVLDTAPIILAADSAGLPSVASDGSTYLVTWSADSVYTVRLGSDGTIGSRSAFATIPSIASGPEPRAPQVAWTGTRFFLGYALRYWSLDCSPCRLWAEIGGSPLDTGGHPTSTKFSAPIAGLDPSWTSFAFAYGGDNVTFVWGRDTYPGGAIVVAQTNMDGLPAGEPRTISNLQSSNDYCAFAPTIGWDGAEQVVAWIDCALTLHAFRLDQLGNPIEAPFDVAANVVPFITSPSIVTTPDGVTIIYSRNDAANGDAPRAFARSLARLPPPRRRSAGH